MKSRKWEKIKGKRCKIETECTKNVHEKQTDKCGALKNSLNFNIIH